MPRREDIDVKTRLRIVAHLRQQMEELGIHSAEAMARKLGVSGSTVSRALAGHMRVGLDLVLKMHRELHMSANRLLDSDPEARFFDGQTKGAGQIPGGPGQKSGR